MSKEDLVKELKAYKASLQATTRNCKRVRGRQIQSKALLGDLETFATEWFDKLDPQLRSSYAFDDSVLTGYREPLGKLLELTGGKPSKSVVITILETLTSSIHSDLIVSVQKHRESAAAYPSLEAILKKSTDAEKEYLGEAIDCANAKKYRAAIILGWCAAVNRLHLYIAKVGFEKLNEASVRMSAMQSGRYKRFNKKFDIQNLTDLRMSVFDGDLLWILEFIGTIDGNQHERLGICFTMRNTCAHPGEASFTEENVLSFFSDINQMVFSNSKFILEGNQAL